MNQQMGLGLFDGPATDFTEQPAGYWLPPEQTEAHWRQVLDRAALRLQGLAGPARALMRLGLAALEAQLAGERRALGLGTEDAFPLRAISLEVSPEALEAFLAHVATFLGSAHPGIAYAHSAHRYIERWAMHVHELGTLLYRRWASGEADLSFMPWRAAMFLGSYRLRIEPHPCPMSVWSSAYCADKLAMAGDGRASVPTFAHQGREYLNDASLFAPDYAECEGWSFRLLKDWPGPTYTYASQCRAWDEGRLERGDRRGLVVLVRGRECVLDGVVVFFDEAPDPVFEPIPDEQLPVDLRPDNPSGSEEGSAGDAS